MSDVREQRLARIEAATATFTLHWSEIDWLLGEARRVPQLEAEIDRLREQNDGLYQATLIVGAERDAAVAALTRIREALLQGGQDAEIRWQAAVAILEETWEIPGSAGVADTTEAQR